MSEETTNTEVQEQEINNTPEPSTNEALQQDATSKPFEIPTEAQEFVGEGKKYKSAEDALKSVPHAQEHIKTLEAEMAVLKEELTKRKTTEELLDELKSGIQPQENTTQAGGLDQDKISQLIINTLEQRERQSKAKQNAASVAEKFTQQYGNKAEEVYQSVAKDAGLSIEQLNNLAATSPNVVLKLSGLESKTTPVAKTSSTINTQAFGTAQKPSEASARVPKGASTKDMLAAWKVAGDKVKSQLNS